MKKVFLIALISIFAYEINATEQGDQYWCITSSITSENDGHCRALSTGHGDRCYPSGTGPACAGTISGVIVGE
ncbi:hypothetical protein ACPUEN_12345 [Algoriphagus yeomjeoni]|uniref:hypothetical protein n=1 Tax=Algoriphagus yeomjeoni TaxID=291403 RepID=UPI003CE5B097